MSGLRSSRGEDRGEVRGEGRGEVRGEEWAWVIWEGLGCAEQSKLGLLVSCLVVLPPPH